MGRPGPGYDPRVTEQPHPARARLLEFALSYPKAHLDHPWGEDVAKVRAKVFLFCGVPSAELYVGVKLPVSGMLAASQPFAKPMAYGLGRSGWVECRFGPEDEPPIDVLMDWIDESYRAVAPRRLVAAVGPRHAAPSS